MASCGLTPNQIERALSPELVTVTSGNTIIKPDDGLVFSLTPQTRAKLYQELGRYGAERIYAVPILFSGQQFRFHGCPERGG